MFGDVLFRRLGLLRSRGFPHSAEVVLRRKWEGKGVKRPKAKNGPGLRSTQTSLPWGTPGHRPTSDQCQAFVQGQWLVTGIPNQDRPKPKPQESSCEGPSHPGSPQGGSRCELCLPAAGATPEGKKTSHMPDRELAAWFNLENAYHLFLCPKCVSIPIAWPAHRHGWGVTSLWSLPGVAG